MADQKHIEPYMKGSEERKSYESNYARDNKDGSPNARSNSPPAYNHRDNYNYQRHSMDRFGNDIRRSRDGEQPAGILKNADNNPHHNYAGHYPGYVPRSYHPRSIPRDGSNSPVKEAWGPKPGDYASTGGYAERRPGASRSPLRSHSPNRMSPPSRPPHPIVQEANERRSLIHQLDDLKNKLHYDYEHDHVEINRLKQEKENDIREILTHKDALVEESHARIQKLKREIEEEERKAERTREENILMQKNHTQRVAELQSQIESSQIRLDQVK